MSLGDKAFLIKLGLVGNKLMGKGLWIKRIIAGTIICLDLFAGAALIVIAPSRCSKGNSSSDLSIDYIDYEDNLSMNLLYIVGKQMKADNFENDALEEVIAISYVEHENSIFDLKINAISSSKLYTYLLNNCNYQGYESIVSFLSTYQGVSEEVTLFKETIISTTFDEKNHYVYSQSDSKQVSTSGYVYTNDEFHIYQNASISGGVSPDAVVDFVIKNDHPLYSYYRAIHEKSL